MKEKEEKEDDHSKHFISFQEEESYCVGKVCLIPDEERDEVIESLDFREKGGYDRFVKSVQLFSSSSSSCFGNEDMEFKEGMNDSIYENNLERDQQDHEEEVSVIVYVGQEENPNFLSQESELQIASIISKAVGPSGPNIEYMKHISRFLRSLRLPNGEGFVPFYDHSLRIERLCFYLKNNQTFVDDKQTLEEEAEGKETENISQFEESKNVQRYCTLSYLGWGNNDHYQIGVQNLQSRCDKENEKREEIIPYPTLWQLQLDCCSIDDILQLMCDCDE